MVRNLVDSIQKMTGKRTDEDISWFEERQQEYEALDNHVRKLHGDIEFMISTRKDLCSFTRILLKNIAALRKKVEENGPVARALSRLSETLEHMKAVYDGQISRTSVLDETVKDYTALIRSRKESFAMRGKSHGTWTSSQKPLASKRDSEQKPAAAAKTEKPPQLNEETSEWEKKDKQYRKKFEEMYEFLCREVARFERERIQEFQENLISYLASLKQIQQVMIRLLKGHLADALGMTCNIHPSPFGTHTQL